MEPKVSVIVPVYNSEKYLRQCVNSLLAQTFREAEFIFVDDGSTDSSVAILEEYQAGDDRIKIIKQQNLHAGVARNNGMKEARGKYLMFLDSDDFFERDMIGKCREAAEKYGAQIVTYQYYEYDDQTGKKKLCGYPSFERSRKLSESDMPLFYREMLGSPWNNMYLREFVEESGLDFPDLPSSEDICFTKTAAYLCRTVFFIDSPFVNYRVNNSTSLVGRADRDLTSITRALAALRKDVTARGLAQGAVLSDLDDYCGSNIETIFYSKYYRASVEIGYNYLKEHLVPDLFADSTHIPGGSLAEAVLKAGSFPEFLWELHLYDMRKENAAQREILLTKSSLTFRLGDALLYVPKRIRSFISGKTEKNK